MNSGGLYFFLSHEQQMLVFWQGYFSMKQTLRAKQFSQAPSRAGRILDYWVAALIAAVARAIRHGRATHRRDAYRQHGPCCGYASCCDAGGINS